MTKIEYSINHSDINHNYVNKNQIVFPTELVNGLQDYVITKVSCGKSHSIAVNEWGQMFAWGSNSSNQLGVETTEAYVAAPKLVRTLATKQVVQVASGNYHNLALTSGTLFALISN